jgi:hypothetical protein
MDQDALATALITTLIGLGPALVLGGFATLWRRQEFREQTAVSFEVEVTKAVRGDRVEAYRALWKVIEPLSSEWKADSSPVPHSTLRANLRHWYYNEGGIFLTAQAQQTFWGLQAALDAGDGDAAYHSSHALRAATRREVWSENAPPATDEVKRPPQV